MEVNSKVVKDVSDCLMGTLNPKTQKEAESKLAEFEISIPNFPFVLLSCSAHETVCKFDLPPSIQIPAVLLLKNLIKKHWANIDSHVFTSECRQYIKMDIFSYISKSNANICSQLSEIICIISQNDFPESWPGLIDQLLSEIDSSNFSANLVILRTCHNIFKRYRLEERSDDLYREINFVMEKFGPALLQIFVGIDGLLKSGNIDRSALELILQNATYANKIFYSLSYQDIPAFFEDNLSSFMTVLMSFYNFHAPDIMSVDNEQPGVLEKFTSSVAKIVILYSTKYEEDFSMLSEFAQATWSILTSRATLYPKDDKLTCTCIEFLASVSKQERHKLIFQNSLKVICDSIIIPNMKLRESDLEIFEDEPMEFIKRDSESSDGLSHRHSSAVSLIHGLMEFYGPEITQILCETVTKSLAYYGDNTSKNWQSKLLATQVFSAVGARGYAEAFGVTSMNPLVNIRDYFNSQVFADLKSSDTSIHPLLTLEAIKFVIYYRNQLGKDDLAQCLPFILTLLESENFIIHTFSAIAIEKILSIKRNGDNLFAISDISSVVGRLSLNILALIFNQKTVEKMCENYFLIKAFVRVLGLAQAGDIDNINLKFSDRIIWLLGEIVKNPISPLFTHYFFESLALMIVSSSSFPGTFNSLESKVVPHMFQILQADQSDLFPYAFQLLAVIIEFNPRPDFPDYLNSLLPVVLQPALWSTSCNIPGLVRFLQSCFAKNPGFFISSQVIESIISIFRILVNSKINDVHGFNLMVSLIGILSADDLSKYIRPVLILILGRIQAHKSQKLGSYFLLFICYIVVESKVSNGASFIIQNLNQIQPNIHFMLFKSLFIPVISRIQEPSDKKLLVFGISQIFIELQSFIQGSSEDISLWCSIISELVKSSSSNSMLSSVDICEDVSTLQGSFNRLVSVPKFRKYSKLLSLPETEGQLLQCVKIIAHSLSAREQLYASLDDSSKAYLNAVLQKYNTSI